MYWFDHNASHRSVDVKDRKRIETLVRKTLDFLLKDDHEREQTDLPPTQHSFSELRGITDELMTISSRRCAYCEGKKENIHWIRYRPSAEVTPILQNRNSKEYYLWFAWDWKNLFPMCSDCRVGENLRVFPVRGKRRPRPTRDELLQWRSQKHLLDMPDTLRKRLLDAESPILFAPGQVRNFGQNFSIDKNGMLIGKTKRAQITIEHYNLNTKRTRKLRSDVLKDRIEGLKRHGPNGEFNFKSSEYGGAWYLTMKRIIGPMIRDSSITGRAYPNQIQNTVRKLYQNPIWNKFDEYVSGPSHQSHQAEQSQSDVPALTTKQDLRDQESYDQGQKEEGKRLKYSTSQPRLTSINVKNFKSLQNVSISLNQPHNTSIDEAFSHSKKDVSESHQTPCLLMLGENATGKSSLLEAVTLAAVPEPVLNDIKSEADIKPEHLILNPKYMGSPKMKGPGKAHVELTFKNQDGVTETHSLDVTSRTLKPKKPNLDTSEALNGNLLVFSYGAHRLFGDRKDTSDNSSPSRNVITLFRNDIMTIDPESWLIDLHDRKDGSLAEIASALRHVIQLDGKFENIEIVGRRGSKNRYSQINLKRSNTTYLKPEIEEKLEHIETKSYILSTPLKYVSSGYRVIIALICDVFKGIMDRMDINAMLAREVPVLVLIDEIEAHLHPRWKLEVISGLRRALPNATFIMSSHDPLCIRGMKNGEVVVFNRFSTDGVGSTRESVETIKKFPDFDLMTVEQLLTSDLFQLYSPNDRKTEKEFSRIIELLRKEKENALSGDDLDTLATFRDKINKNLPVGLSEAERVVQEAVARYLTNRRQNTSAKRKVAREAAITEIMQEFEKIAGPTTSSSPS